MARMRQAKRELRQMLEQDTWRTHLSAIAEGGTTHIGPLFSFLPTDPLLMHRAAVALGAVCANLSQTEMEKARNVVRRYMWHLSEESGNIGWGIPEAFAETLLQSDALAREFRRILITYVIDLGREDNYCDNNVLRRSCYWACGRYAQEKSELCLDWRGWLVKGLDDEDIICRGMACFGLAQLPLNLMDVPKLRAIENANFQDICILFDGENIYEQTVSELARRAVERN
ncbi:MAG: HEAT repeat domain-containing protein [Desulfovibrionaceae bacterium]|nr:HEAT repeat domain-containing protein [Desulfovibrionaceae bacterium]